LKAPYNKVISVLGYGVLIINANTRKTY